MRKKQIFIFLGTMAELIKLAPVIREFQKKKIPFTIISSGQTDIHLEEFKRYFNRPSILYAVTPKSKKSSIIKFNIWAIRAFFSVYIGMRKYFVGLNKTNSYFIVHGDTVSSLIGAFVARLYGLKIVHIESGLRSFNFFEPFPEEICRYIISRLADVHFCPNLWSVNNLKSIKGEKINTRENTLFESFRIAIRTKSRSAIVKELQRKKLKYFVLVIHRQEHVLFNKNKIRNDVIYLMQHIPQDMFCIFMIHDISSMFITSLTEVLSKKTTRKIISLKRLPYHEFMHLLQKAEFFVTDGGSNQEETYYMGKPCLLMRNHTERTEGLLSNVVLSRGNKHIIRLFIKSYKTYIRPTVNISKAPSKIICDYLLRGS